mgnify:CR=1 FL=1
MFRQRRPAGAQIVSSGGLTASVQNDDKAGRWLEVMQVQTRTSGDYPDLTRSPWFRPAGCARPGLQVPPEIPKAIDTVQLWQTSQEFDIVGERHRQLLDESSSNATDNR